MTKKRILIVDDEIKFTAILKMNLEYTGRYIVEEENRGAFVIDAARRFHPHLILLDIVMPDLNGGEVATQLRSDPNLKDIPIIFITALISEAEERTIGGSPYLSKPVKFRTLVSLIDKTISVN